MKWRFGWKAERKDFSLNSRAGKEGGRWRDYHRRPQISAIAVEARGHVGRGWSHKVGRLSQPLSGRRQNTQDPFLVVHVLSKSRTLVSLHPSGSLFLARGSHDGGRSMQIREINARKFHYNSARKISSSSCVFPSLVASPARRRHGPEQSHSPSCRPRQDARSIRII